MKRTKFKQKLKRTIMPEKIQNLKKRVEQDVICYHSHLKNWVKSQSINTLLFWCHPIDRELFEKEIRLNNLKLDSYGIK